MKRNHVYVSSAIACLLISLILLALAAPVPVAPSNIVLKDGSGGISVTTVYCASVQNGSLDGYVQVYRMLVENGSSFPSVASSGYLFFRTDWNQLAFYNGTDWGNCSSGVDDDSMYLLSASATEFLFQNGTRALTADWNAGAFGVYGLTWVNSTSIDALGFYWNGLNRTDAVANPVGSASYIIDVAGTSYRMINQTTGQIDDQNTNRSVLINYAMGNLSLSGGLIYCKDFSVPYTINTVSSNVIIVEDYAGSLTYITSSGRSDAKPSALSAYSLPNPQYNYEGMETTVGYTVGQGSFYNETAIVKEGLGSIQFVGAAVIVTSGWVDENLTASPVDLSNRNFNFWFYISNTSRFRNLYFTLRSNDATWNDYYKVQMSSSGAFPAGQWRYISLTQSSFTTHGSPSWSNINYIRWETEWATIGEPETIYLDGFKMVLEQYKPTVYLRFDDGTSDQYTVAEPIMRSYGYRGVLAVVPSLVGSGGHVTLSQVSQVYNEGWDTVSHSYSHQNLSSLSSQECDYELYASQKWLKDNGLIRGSNMIVIPYGNQGTSTSVINEAHKYYIGVDRFIDSYFDTFQIDFNQMHYIDCTNWTSLTWYPWATIQAQLDNLIADNALAGILVHSVNTTIFPTLIAYLYSNNVNVVTLSDLVNGGTNIPNRFYDSGSTTNCVNGTWIPYNLARTATSITLTLNTSNLVNSTCMYLQPTVIAVNSTHFQIGFLTKNLPINRALNVPISVANFGSTGDLTPPSSLSNAVDGDFSTSTTEGNNSRASSGTIGTITVDLGMAYPVMLVTKVGVWSNVSSMTLSWQYSSNNSTFYTNSGEGIDVKTSTTEYIVYSQVDFSNMRYIQLLAQIGAAGNGSIKVYEIQAWDMSQTVAAVTATNVATVNWIVNYKS
jgi:peptidoglycan/xylan/chitin deacetylase (PgdA/CDA1 family)